MTVPANKLFAPLKAFLKGMLTQRLYDVIDK